MLISYKHTLSQNKLKICSFFASLLLCFYASPCFSYLPTWQLLYQPRQRVVKSIAIYNEEIFIGTGNGVLVSNDKGKNWKDFGTSQLSKDINGNSFINWINIDEENKKI